MPIRMIVTDLDGTLLRGDKTISGYTQAVLRRCPGAGIKTAFATGRGGSAYSLLTEGLFEGRITMNGTIAEAGETVIYNRLIPCELARPILTACGARGLKAASELNGTHYSNFDVAREWNMPRRFEITDFSRHSLDAEKLYAVTSSPEDIAFLEGQLPGKLYLSVSRDGLAMIMHREATKAKAIAALAGIWGITLAEIAAFGDDTNDLDMLAACGFGVAMANAIPEAKEIARDLCDTNDNDGVAKWIEERVLSQCV